MNDMCKELMNKRLKCKKEELKQKQEFFNIMCHNEMQSYTFERNAISDLVIMQQLKSEIRELEHTLEMLEIQAF